MQKKIIFLSHESLESNVIHSQLFFNAKFLNKKKIKYEIWIFACGILTFIKSFIKLIKNKNYKNYKISIYPGLYPFFFWSEHINSLILKLVIIIKNIYPITIHARTDYSSHVASIVNKNFIWDCRGDAISELKYKYKNRIPYFNFFKRYRISKLKKNILESTKASKKIFVTKFLMNKFKFKESPTCKIWGCFASKKYFYFSEMLRDKTRKELLIEKEKKVILYSGGIQSYQKFQKCIEIANLLNKEWIFLVVTNNIEIASKYLKKCKIKSILKSVEFHDVNKYLNCGDIGLIIRDNSSLNKVAFPTKYSEYCLAGLLVCFSDSLLQLKEYNKLIKNRVSIECIKNFNINLTMRKKISIRSEILCIENRSEEIVNFYKK
jgi:hypothetical protein